MLRGPERILRNGTQDDGKCGNNRIPRAEAEQRAHVPGAGSF